MKQLIRKASERYRAAGLRGLTRSVWGRVRRNLVETKWPQFDQRELDALGEVLKSRGWGGNPYPGKHIGPFAENFARFHTAKHGICCNSGTTALVVALRAAGVKGGDEVLVPALTFAATATAVLEVQATPVFVDVDPASWCMDHGLAANQVGPRTKAIIPVHLGCRMADMDAILQLAKQYGLKVIEDAAHMHGGAWRSKGAGSLGDFGCFSFQASKTMTAGEGGIILTNTDQLADHCHAYVNLGRLPEGMEQQSILGSNLRMTEFQAALLNVQLQRLREHMKIRARNYELFDQLLADIDGVEPLAFDERVTGYSGYGYYFKYLSERCGGVSRDRFLIDLEGYGIIATSGWRPVYHSPEFGWRGSTVGSNYSQIDCPEAEKAAYEQGVWLLHYTFLCNDEEIRRMSDSIAGLVSRYRKGDVQDAVDKSADENAKEPQLE